MPKQLTKLNSTKAQRRQQAQQRLVVAKAPKPQRKKGRKGATVSPYVKMVSSPMANHNLFAYPDGSQMPSFVYRHKGVVTILPTTDGKISFAMIPSASGAIAVNNSNGFTWGMPSYTSAGVFGGWAARTRAPGATLSTGKAMILPFTEYTGADIFGVGNSGLPASFNASAFRVLASECRIMYTGSSLNDSGVLVADRRPIDYTLNTLNTVLPVTNVTLQADMVDPYALPIGVTGQYGSNGNTEIVAAREPIRSRLVNNNPEFVPVEVDRYVLTDSATPASMGVAWYSTTANDTSTGNWAGADAGLPACHYNYSGLNPASSITVEYSTIIEYAVGSYSTLAGLAQPNPPRDSVVQDLVQRLYYALPTIERLGSAAGRFAYAALAGAATSRAVNRNAIRDEM